MKKIYLLILGFLFSISSNAQTITIPDVYFKNKLVTSTTSNGVAKDSFGNSIKIDANNNGEIELSEIQNIAAINVAGFSPIDSGNIISMDGIQSFTNLKVLKCSNNHISNLDVTVLTNMEHLYCGGNLMTNLSVQNLSSLIELDCEGNQLTSLNLSGLNSLTHLNISNNLIPTINVLSLTNMSSLHCGGNPLTSIDINGLSTLSFFNIDTTLISALDCSLSGVTQLSCSNNPNLTYINVRNNLFTSSDPDLLSFGFTFENLTALTGICLDFGEEVNLNYTNYNSSGNVILYTGASCDIIVPFNPMSANGFSAADDFKIYPNPVNNVMNVSVKEETLIKAIYVYNNLGQLVQTVSNFNSTTLDMSNLKSGYYFMEIVSDKGKAIEKFIKN